MTSTLTLPGDTGSAAFSAVVRGTLALHRLLARGEGESVEADLLRDALDEPYAGLTPSEAERVRLLSADLYSLSEPADRPTREPNPQVHKAFHAIYEARQRKEWDKALSLLRRWQEYLPPATLSTMRGFVWAQQGRYEVAADFFQHAAKLEPAGDASVLHLHALARVDAAAAELRAREILRQSDLHPPALVVQAAQTVVAATRTRSPDETRRSEVEVTPIVREAIRKLEAEEGEQSEAIGMAALLLASAHEHSGETSEAYNYYSRALKVAPDNSDILTLRGILMYGVNSGAVSDLARAVQLDRSAVWAHVVLAHHLLTSNRFEECRQMCERALELPVSRHLQSELTDWLAIAETQLAFPTGHVRRRFEEAVRLDPTNDRARRNLEVFEAQVTRHPAPTLKWVWPSAATIRAVGLAEYRSSYHLVG